MLEKLTTVPLVIAAHGTRDPEGVTACRALAERVRTKLPGTKVTIGFIELAEPRIPEAGADALKDSAPRGGAEAVVVPLMLASGGHVRIDIPEAIDKGRGNSEVAYSAALLGSPLLDSAVRRRVIEALGEWRPQDTACILVGRGSSVVGSNAERYRMARVLMEEAGLRSIHPAFIQVSRPSVPEALNHAKATGVKKIVVAPHFLFPGKLRTWNLDQVAAWRENNPD
ncbi:MAG: sirohydrochlorin chelatase, partial [Propionibacterium sp.]|nr:sirohydrochlorin chelatase [Propionibacterium sp.]